MLKKSTRFLPVTLLFIGATVSGQADKHALPTSANDLVCANDNGGIQLPAHFCALVFADDIGRARHLTVRENGDIYVALRNPSKGGGIVALSDTDGDGRADKTARFGKAGGTGSAIYNDYLYFGTPTAIIRYPLSDTELTPSGELETIVEDFPEQDEHATKTFAFDDNGWLYVNVGAPSNACQQETRTPASPGLDPCPQLKKQGGIWRYRANQLHQQHTEDHRYATGIRNAVAIAWNSPNDALYVVPHGRDQLHQLWPKLFSVEQNAELPAEEFFKVTQGANFGWPYCYYDQRQNKKVLAPEYGGDGRKSEGCEKFAGPIMAFPGHWAPNGLLFYTGDSFPDHYQNGAFIAFHGSWNRAPLEQAGYKVVFVPFKEGSPADAWEVFADGFAGVKHLNAPDQAKFRPMGLAQGPDGSLYISDSVQGRIWRVLHRAQPD
jgi:glucose/arabinose dehydrogenase